jgi:hypothetical protein
VINDTPPLVVKIVLLGPAADRLAGFAGPLPRLDANLLALKKMTESVGTREKNCKTCSFLIQTRPR